MPAFMKRINKYDEKKKFLLLSSKIIIIIEVNISLNFLRSQETTKILRFPGFLLKLLQNIPHTEDIFKGSIKHLKYEKYVR